MSFYELGEGQGVLEFDDPALELHWICRGDRLDMVWWVDDLGTLLAFAPVGLA